jgi:hypothetical protein
VPGVGPQQHCVLGMDDAWLGPLRPSLPLPTSHLPWAFVNRQTQLFEAAVPPAPLGTRRAENLPAGGCLAVPHAPMRRRYGRGPRCFSASAALTHRDPDSLGLGCVACVRGVCACACADPVTTNPPSPTFGGSLSRWGRPLPRHRTQPGTAPSSLGGNGYHGRRAGVCGASWAGGAASRYAQPPRPRGGWGGGMGSGRGGDRARW